MIKKNLPAEFIRKNNLLILAAILAIAAFNLLFLLSSDMVQDWDESRPGINAYEMVKNNNYIVSTYMDQTDYWNTKPPLGFWMIALSYKIFGFTVFALRIPAVIMTFLSMILTILLSRKHFGVIASVLSGFIIATCLGFIFAHSGRSGDLDAGIAFFTILSYYFLDRSEKQFPFFYLAGLSIGLAFLYKSFAIFPILAVTFFYLIFAGRFLKIKVRQYLLFIVCFLVPVLAWGFARYAQDGFSFFQKMIGNDLLARTRILIEGQSDLNIFSLINVVLNGVLPWSVFLFIFPFYKNKISLRKAKGEFPLRFQWNEFYKTPLFWLWIVMTLFLFSCSKTKLYWYLVPIYPGVAIFLGWHFADILESDSMPNKFFALIKKIIVPVLALFMIVAESQYLWPGRYHFADDQKLIIGLSPAQYQDRSVFYLTGPVPPAKVFLLRVVKHLNFGTMGRDVFPLKASPADLLLLENNADNSNFIAGSKLSVITNNNGYSIVRKNR